MIERCSSWSFHFASISLEAKEWKKDNKDDVYWSLARTGTGTNSTKSRIARINVIGRLRCAFQIDNLCSAPICRVSQKARSRAGTLLPAVANLNGARLVADLNWIKWSTRRGASKAKFSAKTATASSRSLLLHPLFLFLFLLLWLRAEPQAKLRLCAVILLWWCCRKQFSSRFFSSPSSS